jgi:regulator of protease activity HflC (stomatin/prohibitin superfamily)
MTGNGEKEHKVGRGKKPSRLRRWWRRRLVELSLLGLFVLFVVVYFYKTMLITIGPGELGVKYKRFAGGTVLNQVYQEGFHFVFPWDRMYVYDVRIQRVSRKLELLTRNGLPVQVYASIRYHPEREILPLLHQRIGPDYADRIVLPEVDAALRRHIGQHDAETLYQTRGGLLYDILDEARIETVERYAVVDDVLIQRIELPKPVAAAIEQKIVYLHEAQAYEFRNIKEAEEATRKRIEAEGFRVYNDTIRESLDDRLLKWRGIQATEQLAKSNNSKVVIMGNGTQQLPVLLSGQ